jgi:CRP/FNR family cyclic AMP-dependent transcriptional regulator
MDINVFNLQFKERIDLELEDLLSQKAEILTIPSKTTFLYQYEDFNSLYFIRKGRTCHYMLDERGVQKILYTLNRGWFFGEIAAILNIHYTSLFSFAEEDTIIYKLNSIQFKELMDSSKVFRDSLMSCICYKLISLRYEIENLVFNSTRDRLIRYLCMNVDETDVEDGNWLNQRHRKTHYEIGIVIGTTRVSVSRLIRDLRDEGIIRIVNNAIQVNKDFYEKTVESFMHKTSLAQKRKGNQPDTS